MIKVGVLCAQRSPPFCMYDEKTKIFSGIAVDLWKKIAESKNYEYEFIFAGTNYSDAISDIKKYDILIGDFIKSERRLQYVDFTIPFFLSKHTFIERDSHIAWKLLKYILSFIVILFTIIIACVPITISILATDKIIQFQNFKKYTFLKEIFTDAFLFTALSFIYRKPSVFKPYSSKTKILMWFYALGGFLLLCLFVAGMIEIFKNQYSDSSQPYKDKQIVTTKNKKNTYKNIRDKYAIPNPVKLKTEDSITPLLDEFLKNKKNDYLKVHEDKAYYFKKKKSKYGDIDITENELGWLGRYFILPKKSKYLQEINTEILKLRASNETKNIIKKYLSYRQSKYAMI